MKKTFTLSVLLLLTLFFSMLGNSTTTFDPLELTIAMDKEFIHGNTSKNITITNNDSYSINVTWYIEHPNPKSYLRPNRTLIPDLSWIDVKPKWLVIPPAYDGRFYIHLDIPENEELLNQHWETWVTFQLDEHNGGNDIFEHEYAIRVYMDTPQKAAFNNSSNNSNLNYHIIYYIFIAVSAITLLILGILFYKKKMSKK